MIYWASKLSSLPMR